jgi:S-adenosylmethionine synthetase
MTTENRRTAHLLNLMTENNINKISLHYSGSGDSGGVDEFLVGEEEDYFDHIEMQDLAESILYDIVDPNFNNDGSGGKAYFIINDEGKLVFQCCHRDLVPDETTFNRTFEHKKTQTAN